MQTAPLPEKSIHLFDLYIFDPDIYKLLILKVGLPVSLASENELGNYGVVKIGVLSPFSAFKLVNSVK